MFFPVQRSTHYYDTVLLFQSGHQWFQTTMASRRKKVHQHFDDLEQCYFNLRHRDLLTNGDSQSMEFILKLFMCLLYYISYVYYTVYLISRF